MNEEMKVSKSGVENALKKGLITALEAETMLRVYLREGSLRPSKPLHPTKHERKNLRC